MLGLDRGDCVPTGRKALWRLSGAEAVACELNPAAPGVRALVAGRAVVVAICIGLAHRTKIDPLAGYVKGYRQTFRSAR